MKVAQYPSYDGLSDDRDDLLVRRAPGPDDWDQIVAEMLKHQDLLALDDDEVSSFSMVAAAAGANVCEVTITAKNRAGDTVAAPHVFEVWLSDSSAGTGLTATTASGTVQAKASNGAVFATHTSKKSLLVQSLATGVFVLEITDTAKTAFKVAVKTPGRGQTLVGVTLSGASYG